MRGKPVAPRPGVAGNGRARNHLVTRRRIMALLEKIDPQRWRSEHSEPQGSVVCKVSFLTFPPPFPALEQSGTLFQRGGLGSSQM